MFVVNEKIKDVFRTYHTLLEEKLNTMPTETITTNSESGEMDRKRMRRECRCTNFAGLVLICILCSIVMLVFVHYVLLPRRDETSNGILIADLGQQASLQATAMMNDARTIVNDVRQQNTRISKQNVQVATDYLKGVQDVLEKRVGDSVNKISHLVLEGVQNIENEIALFERSLSTLLSGVVDVSKHSIADIETGVKNVSTADDKPKLDKAIQQVRDEISQLIHNFDDMFNYQAGHLREVISDKIQNVTDRVLKIMVADSKRIQNLMGLHVAFCYKISRQNYEISVNLEKVLEVINLLQKATDALNILSSSSFTAENPSVVEARHALSVELNNTKEIFYTMMNANDIFLSTTLKELAYQKHTDMRDFVYKNYETVIKSFLPTVDRVTRNGKIVKDSHWQQVVEVIHPAFANLSMLMKEKASLITNGATAVVEHNSTEIKPVHPSATSRFQEIVATKMHDNNTADAVTNSESKSAHPSVTNKLKEIAAKVRSKNSIIHVSELESVYRLMENRFKEIASKVNLYFKTKRGYMIEGFELSWVAIMDEKLPNIAAWSLWNYVPSDACPITVEFQTYVKGIMDQYLSRSSSLKEVVSTN